MGGLGYQPVLPEGADSPSEFAHGEDVPLVPVRAAQVVDEWAKEAAAAASMHSELGWSKEWKVMNFTHTLLGLMSIDINAGLVDYVYALAAGEEAEDVQAVAVVSHFDVERTGRLASLALERGLAPEANAAGGADMVEVVDIEGVVARPAADRPPGAGAELVRRIIDWAEGAGCLVTIRALNDELAEYYRGLGFEPIAGDEHDMVYGGGPGSEGPPARGPRLRLVELEP